MPTLTYSYYCILEKGSHCELDLWLLFSFKKINSFVSNSTRIFRVANWLRIAPIKITAVNSAILCTFPTILESLGRFVSYLLWLLGVPEIYCGSRICLWRIVYVMAIWQAQREGLGCLASELQVPQRCVFKNNLLIQFSSHTFASMITFISVYLCVDL